MDQMEMIVANHEKDAQLTQTQINELKRKQIENGILQIQQLSMQKRAQLAQEDACCAICSIGDYEDDD